MPSQVSQSVLPYDDDYVLMSKRSMLINTMSTSILIGLIAEDFQESEETVTQHVSSIANEEIMRMDDAQIRECCDSLIATSWKRDLNSPDLFTRVEVSVTANAEETYKPVRPTFQIRKNDFVVMNLAHSIAIHMLSKKLRMSITYVGNMLSLMANKKIKSLTVEDIEKVVATYLKERNSGKPTSVVEIGKTPDESA